MKNFKKYNMVTFYDMLLSALKGKTILLRSYKKLTGHQQYVWDDNGVCQWNEDAEFYEWQGQVENILECDNSHVDIIFARNEHHKYPEGCNKDCFNWHMNDYLQILS